MKNNNNSYKRPNIDEYYSLITYIVSLRSTCIKEGRQFGAIIVKDRQIIAEGYNGAPAGIKSCDELGYCVKELKNYKSGTAHDICIAVHAELNALIKAGRNALGADLYVNGFPCIICARAIINAGIKRVIISGTYSDKSGIELLEEAGTTVKYVNVNLEWLDIVKKLINFHSNSLQVKND